MYGSNNYAKKQPSQATWTPPQELKICTKDPPENSKKKSNRARNRDPQSNFKPQKITAREAQHLKNYTP